MGHCWTQTCVVGQTNGRPFKTFAGILKAWIHFVQSKKYTNGWLRKLPDPQRFPWLSVGWINCLGSPMHV